MKKDFILLPLALAGGVSGFLLRRWQLTSAFVPETGLFIPGHPATIAVLALVGLLALLLLLLARGPKEGPEDFLPAFGCSGTGQMTLLAASGLLLMAAGGLGLKDGLEAMQLWRSGPDFYPFSNAGAQMLACGLCLPGGLGILLMGRMAYRWELDNTACRLAAFPAFAGLVWLFASHLKNGTEPVLMKYGFQLAAALLFTLAHYDIAGFLFGKVHRWRTVFLSLTGVVMGLISLADQPDLFTVVITLAYSLSALAFSRALLAAPWPERMPPAEEEEQEK